MSSLFIDFVARFAQFSDALTRIEGQATRTATSMQSAFGGLRSVLAGLGIGLSAGGMVAFVKQAINAQDEMGKMAQRVGIASESLSALQYSAQLADVPVETLAQSLKKLSVNMVETQAGTGEARDAFRALGVSVESTKGNLKGTDAFLFEIADRFAEMEDGAGKTAIAVKLFGRAGSDLIPLLNAGSKGLKENAEEAKRFGLIISTEATKKSEEFNDNLTRLNATTKAYSITLANEMLPALNKFVQELLSASTAAAGFWKGLALSATTDTSDPVKRLGEITKQLEKLKTTRLELQKNDTLAAKIIPSISDDDIRNVNRQIAVLEKQRALLTDLATRQGAGEKDTFEFGGTKPLKKAPPIVDRDKIARDAESARKKLEQEAEAAQNSLNNLTEQRSKFAVDAEQRSATARIAILNRFYQDGFVSEERYWQSLSQIRKEAHEVESKAIDKDIASRDIALKKAEKEKGSGSKEARDALKDLEAAQERRNKLDKEYEDIGNIATLDQARAAKQYADELVEVNIQLQEMLGNTRKAAELRFDKQNAPLLQKAANRGGEEGAEGEEAVKRLRESTLAQVDFNRLRERGSEISARLAIEEERIQNSQRTGAISDLAALAQTGRARQDAVKQLRVLSEEMSNLKLPENLQLDAERFRVSIESLATQADLLGDKFKTVFEEAFSDEFAKVISGTQKISTAFKNMATRIIAELAKIQAKELAQSITSSSSKSGAGIFGSILGLFAKVIGGGGGGGMTFGDNPEFAMGTDFVPKTGLALVHKGERIIPANENTGGWGEAQSNVSIQNVYNIDSRSDRAEIGAAIKASEQRTLSQVANLTRRGGGFSKAIRG